MGLLILILRDQDIVTLNIKVLESHAAKHHTFMVSDEQILWSKGTIMITWLSFKSPIVTASPVFNVDTTLPMKHPHFTSNPKSNKTLLPHPDQTRLKVAM